VADLPAAPGSAVVVAAAPKAAVEPTAPAKTAAPSPVRPAAMVLPPVPPAPRAEPAEALEALFGQRVDLVIAGAVENPCLGQDIDGSRETVYAA
jgi:hypothetical protein